MKTLNGKYNTAIVYNKDIEANSESQILQYLDHPGFSGTKVRVMPDVHVGKGAVVGFTSTLGDRVVPHIVGVDIGCGVSAWKVTKRSCVCEKLDRFIRKKIAFGKESREEPFPELERIFLAGVGQDYQEFSSRVDDVSCATGQRKKYVWRGPGSLGGGNHFIEVDRSQDGTLWLLIHSGSRNFGYLTATWHQDIAVRKTGPESPIKYLEGGDAALYLEHMKTVQEYARLNRAVMGAQIVERFFKQPLEETEYFDTVHNYISFRDNIVRKGAISAHEGERVIIPFSMADGAVIGTGKGNPEWNYSAPHGAGRKMARGRAKSGLDLDQFRKRMHGIWSSCVGRDTLDESPMAYKNAEKILGLLDETIEVTDRLKPIYNFKAGE